MEVPKFTRKERCPVTVNSKQDVDNGRVESSDRRQFLRNAMQIGGAVALALTPASRHVLARSLSLSGEQEKAARRAQLVQGDPSRGREQASCEEPYGAHGSCENSCQGGCQGCSAACTHSCSGSCEGGCQGDCRGACQGGCKGGCQGTCEGTGESRSSV